MNTYVPFVVCAVRMAYRGEYMHLFVGDDF